MIRTVYPHCCSAEVIYGFEQIAGLEEKIKWQERVERYLCQKYNRWGVGFVTAILNQAQYDGLAEVFYDQGWRVKAKGWGNHGTYVYLFVKITGRKPRAKKKLVKCAFTPPRIEANGY